MGEPWWLAKPRGGCQLSVIQANGTMSSRRDPKFKDPIPKTPVVTPVTANDAIDDDIPGPINTINPLSETLDFEIPSARKFENSKVILETLVKNGQLTPDGYAFLKLATDPWHDNKVPQFKGIPDMNQGNSVVCSILQELQVSMPDGFTGPWSCRISTNPIQRNVVCNDCDVFGNTAERWNTSNVNMYPVMIDFADGSADFPDYRDSNSLGIKLDDSYLAGPSKVVAVGIEGVNTTADVYQQGLCTASDMNQQPGENWCVNLFDGGVSLGSFNVFPVRVPPKNLGEALLLPNTTQWHAREGFYAVVQLLELASLPAQCGPLVPIFLKDGVPSPMVEIPSALLPATASASLNGHTHQCQTSYPGKVPMNTKCVMFTGLSTQSTITVRVRWILERYPNDNQPDILVLATPSPSLDAMALELYSRTMRALPPAVMFKYNNSTDWWKSVLATMADVAASGLMLIPHPLAKGVGAAIGALKPVVENVVRDYDKKKKEPKKLEQAKSGPRVLNFQCQDCKKTFNSLKARTAHRDIKHPVKK